MRVKRKTLIYITFFLALILLFAFIYRERIKIGRVFAPFFIGILIAYLLAPLVKRLEGRHISRRTSILLIYLLSTLLLGGITVFIIPELVNNTKDLMNTLPDITNQYQQMFDRIMNQIQSSKWPKDVKNAIFQQIYLGTAKVEALVMDTLKQGMNTLIKTVTMLLNLILSMIIAYYLIKDAESFREAALSLVPRKWRNWLIGTGREVNEIMSRFIQGQMITAAIVGSIEILGLYIVGVKYPVILGAVGGIANIIPYFGPVIGAIPAIAIALLDSPMRAVWTLVLFILVQQLDNSFISPRIIESKLGLHPITTILVVLIGGEFFGLLGLLLSVPLAAMLKVILKRSIEAIV